MLQGIENPAEYKLSVAQCLQKHHYADELPVLMRVIDPSRPHFLKPISKMRFGLGLIFFICLLLPARAEEAIARGRYLAILGDCAGCHTEANGPAFAAACPSTPPSARSIPPTSRPTAKPASANGRRRISTAPCMKASRRAASISIPPFPISISAASPAQDTDDLFAYLQTLKPVHREPPRPTG